MSIVRLDVSHSNLDLRFAEIPFPLTTTIEALKRKLYGRTGTAPEHQEVFLKFADGRKIFLAEDAKTLEDYGCDSTATIFVHDTDESKPKIDFSEPPPEYKLDKERYNEISGEFLRFKKKQIEKRTAQRVEEKRERGDKVYTLEEVEKEFPLNARCEVTGGRRGVIAYRGNLKEKPRDDFYCGILLDDPEGETDGSYRGTKYFEAEQSCGTFAKVEFVKVGNFAVRDFSLSSEDEI